MHTRRRTSCAGRYDPYANKWTLVSPMSYARSSAAAVVLGGKIIIAGT
jgi:hypothetical protein